MIPLLRTLKHWVEVDDLKKFKLVITSRPEDSITQTFPDSISTHVNIPSGNDVKLEDKASDDIHVFFKSRLDNMRVGDEWVKKAPDCLVPRATGIFIWATTVAEFLELDPEVRFDILEARRRGDDTEGLDDLYSLYSSCQDIFRKNSKARDQGNRLRNRRNEIFLDSHSMTMCL